MIQKIQKMNNKKGFTLVELIIVIAVMAILAAIVVPRMAGITGSFKEKADQKTCAMYARVIQAKIEINNTTGITAGTLTKLVNAGTPSTNAVIGEEVKPTQVSGGAYWYLYDSTANTVTVSASTDSTGASPYATVTVDAKVIE